MQRSVNVYGEVRLIAMRARTTPFDRRGKFIDDASSLVRRLVGASGGAGGGPSGGGDAQWLSAFVESAEGLVPVDVVAAATLVTVMTNAFTNSLATYTKGTEVLWKCSDRVPLLAGKDVAPSSAASVLTTGITEFANIVTQTIVALPNTVVSLSSGANMGGGVTSAGLGSSNLGSGSFGGAGGSMSGPPGSLASTMANVPPPTPAQQQTAVVRAYQRLAELAPSVAMATECARAVTVLGTPEVAGWRRVLAFHVCHILCRTHAASFQAEAERFLRNVWLAGRMLVETLIATFPTLDELDRAVQPMSIATSHVLRLARGANANDQFFDRVRRTVLNTASSKDGEVGAALVLLDAMSRLPAQTAPATVGSGGAGGNRLLLASPPNPLVAGAAVTGSPRAAAAAVAGTDSNAASSGALLLGNYDDMWNSIWKLRERRTLRWTALRAVLVLARAFPEKFVADRRPEKDRADPHKSAVTHRRTLLEYVDTLWQGSMQSAQGNGGSSGISGGGDGGVASEVPSILAFWREIILLPHNSFTPLSIDDIDKYVLSSCQYSMQSTKAGQRMTGRFEALSLFDAICTKYAASKGSDILLHRVAGCVSAVMTWGRITDEMITTLPRIVRCLSDDKAQKVVERLLDIVSITLCGRPYRTQTANSTASTSSPAAATKPPTPQAAASSSTPADIVNALRTVIAFELAHHPLMGDFVSQAMLGLLSHPDADVRLTTVNTIAHLAVPKTVAPPPATTSSAAVVSSPTSRQPSASPSRRSSGSSFATSPATSPPAAIKNTSVAAGSPGVAPASFSQARSAAGTLPNPSATALSGGSLSVSRRLVVDRVVAALLPMTTFEPVVAVRLACVSSVIDKFVAFVPPSLLRYVFAACNDSSVDVRVASIVLLCKLHAVHPAVVEPARRSLIVTMLATLGEFVSSTRGGGPTAGTVSAPTSVLKALSALCHSAPAMARDFAANIASTITMLSSTFLLSTAAAGGGGSDSSSGASSIAGGAARSAVHFMPDEVSAYATCVGWVAVALGPLLPEADVVLLFDRLIFALGTLDVSAASSDTGTDQDGKADPGASTSGGRSQTAVLALSILSALGSLSQHSGEAAADIFSRSYFLPMRATFRRIITNQAAPLDIRAEALRVISIHGAIDPNNLIVALRHHARLLQEQPTTHAGDALHAAMHEQRRRLTVTGSLRQDRSFTKLPDNLPSLCTITLTAMSQELDEVAFAGGRGAASSTGANRIEAVVRYQMRCLVGILASCRAADPHLHVIVPSLLHVLDSIATSAALYFPTFYQAVRCVAITLRCLAIAQARREPSAPGLPFKPAATKGDAATTPVSPPQAVVVSPAVDTMPSPKMALPWDAIVEGFDQCWRSGTRNGYIAAASLIATVLASDIGRREFSGRIQRFLPPLLEVRATASTGATSGSPSPVAAIGGAAGPTAAGGGDEELLSSLVCAIFFHAATGGELQPYLFRVIQRLLGMLEQANPPCSLALATRVVVVFWELSRHVYMGEFAATLVRAAMTVHQRFIPTPMAGGAEAAGSQATISSNPSCMAAMLAADPQRNALTRYTFGLLSELVVQLGPDFMRIASLVPAESLQAPSLEVRQYRRLVDNLGSDRERMQPALLDRERVAVAFNALIQDALQSTSTWGYATGAQLVPEKCALVTMNDHGEMTSPFLSSTSHEAICTAFDQLEQQVQGSTNPASLNITWLCSQLTVFLREAPYPVLRCLIDATTDPSISMQVVQRVLHPALRSVWLRCSGFTRRRIQSVLLSLLNAQVAEEVYFAVLDMAEYMDIVGLPFEDMSAFRSVALRQEAYAKALQWLEEAYRGQQSIMLSSDPQQLDTDAFKQLVADLITVYGKTGSPVSGIGLLKRLEANALVPAEFLRFLKEESLILLQRYDEALKLKRRDRGVSMAASRPTRHQRTRSASFADSFASPSVDSARSFTPTGGSTTTRSSADRACRMKCHFMLGNMEEVVAMWSGAANGTAAAGGSATGRGAEAPALSGQGDAPHLAPATAAAQDGGGITSSMSGRRHGGVSPSTSDSPLTPVQADDEDDETVGSDIVRYAAEAALALQRWDVVDETLNHPQFAKCAVPYWLTRAAMGIHRGAFDDAMQSIQQGRMALVGETATLLGESYARAYDGLVLGQALTELEEGAYVCRAEQLDAEAAASSEHWTGASSQVGSSRIELLLASGAALTARSHGGLRHQVKALWDARMGRLSPDVFNNRRLLALRRLLIPASEDLVSRLQYVSLCRVNHLGALERRALVEIIGAVPTREDLMGGLIEPSVVLQYARYLCTSAPASERDAYGSDLGHLLDDIIASLIGNDRAPGAARSDAGGVIARLLSLKATVLQEAAASHPSRKLAAWRQTLDIMSTAIRHDPTWVRGWQQFSLASSRLLEANPSDLSLLKQAVHGYCMSLRTATVAARGSVVRTDSETASRLTGSNGATAPTAGSDTTRGAGGNLQNAAATSNGLLLVLSLWSAYVQNKAAVVDVIAPELEGIPVHAWLSVVPQLIARIDLGLDDSCDLAVKVLTPVAEEFPNELIFPLLLSSSVSSSSSTVGTGGTPVVARRERNSNRLLEALKRSHPQLFTEGRMVSEELCRLSREWWLTAISDIWETYLAFSNEPSAAAAATSPNAKKLVATMRRFHERVDKPQSLMELGFTTRNATLLKEAERNLRRFESEPQTRAHLYRAFRLYERMYHMPENKVTSKNIELAQWSPKLFEAKQLRLALPGQSSAAQGAVPLTIAAFGTTAGVISSKQAPRRITVVASDGSVVPYLLKSGEDLRLDERVMQLFSLINSLLAAASRDRQSAAAASVPPIERYSVTPLSNSVGVIGWVEGCDTFYDLISMYRKNVGVADVNQLELRLRGDVIPETRTMNEDATHLTVISQVELFEYVCDATSGEDLRRIFWSTSNDSEHWLSKRAMFTQSLATMSIGGYVLGLGDRHVANIMIQRSSGKVVHIDFGDCFEVCMNRPKVPERVPFRLTRMLRRNMEVADIEGHFRTTCEHVMAVMRDNRAAVSAMLEAFIYDPLVAWGGDSGQSTTEQAAPAEGQPQRGTASELQHHAFGMSNADDDPTMAGGADRLTMEASAAPSVAGGGATAAAAQSAGPQHLGVAAMRRINLKLRGREWSSDAGGAALNGGALAANGGVVSPAKQVDLLLKQATDAENLAQSFVGWFPWW